MRSAFLVSGLFILLVGQVSCGSGGAAPDGAVGGGGSAPDGAAGAGGSAPDGAAGAGGAGPAVDGAVPVDATASEDAATEARPDVAGNDTSPADADTNVTDAARHDADVADAAPPIPDATTPDTAPVLEAVAHARELRAVWLASVFRLDFPSRVNLTATEARAELGQIVDGVAAAGLNAINFQVRPESDALYASTLEPWSRFVSGTQGTNPGYDPLALLIESAHAKGIEVHAWMTPYRALATAGAQTSANHVTNRLADAAITYNGAVTMNPADPRVRAHVVAVVTEVTHDYDIDGVVFDDYFYPSPGATAYPDDASYNAYLGGGGTLSKSDWRRDNVNKLVAAVASAIRSEKPWVRWGVAPVGIYRPGMPAGVTGLDAYEVLSCDSLHWMNQGWVDYLAPQIYWETTSAGQPFGALLDWWAGKAKPGRPIFPSLALYKLGTTTSWTTSEYATQIALTRNEGANVAGQVHFRFDMLRDDVASITGTFKTAYATPARPPVVPGTAAGVVAPPTVSVTAGSVTLGHATVGTIRGYAVYRLVNTTWTYVKWVPAATTSSTLAAGRYAISAIDRGGVESLGVSVLVP